HWLSTKPFCVHSTTTTKSIQNAFSSGIYEEKYHQLAPKFSHSINFDNCPVRSDASSKQQSLPVPSDLQSFRTLILMHFAISALAFVYFIYEQQQQQQQQQQQR